MLLLAPSWCLDVTSMKGKGLSPGLELLSDSSKADCTLKAGVFPGPKIDLNNKGNRSCPDLQAQ